MIRQLSKSTIMKRYRMFSANRETPGNRLHHRQPGVSYSTIPSFLNLASISSMCLPIFSGSLSRPAQMTRRPSGVKMRPCSLSVWYCWYFSYSLHDDLQKQIQPGPYPTSLEGSNEPFLPEKRALAIMPPQSVSKS